jgi:hypothetical protein
MIYIYDGVQSLSTSRSAYFRLAFKQHAYSPINLSPTSDATMHPRRSSMSKKCALSPAPVRSLLLLPNQAPAEAHQVCGGPGSAQAIAASIGGPLRRRNRHETRDHVCSWVRSAQCSTRARCVKQKIQNNYYFTCFFSNVLQSYDSLALFSPYRACNNCCYDI